MGEVSPAAVNVAILAAGLLLYALIWYLTRGLPWFAKVLARLLPLGLVLPAMIIMSGHNLAPRRELATAPPPPAARREVPPTAGAPAPAEPKSAAAPPSAALPPPPVSQPASRSLPGTDGSAPAPASPREAEKEPTRSLAGPPPGAPKESGMWCPSSTARIVHGRTNPSACLHLRARPPARARARAGDGAEDAPGAQHRATVRPARAVYQHRHLRAGRGPQAAFHDQARSSRCRASSSSPWHASASAAAPPSRTRRWCSCTATTPPSTTRCSAPRRWPTTSSSTAPRSSTAGPRRPASRGYGYDRESSEQAEPYLREYLELVVKETGAKSVSVIAHSMGNMPLLRVLQSLGPSLPPGVQLNQIILAAPDVDRNLFENLAANIKRYGRGVTLYASVQRPGHGRRRGAWRAASLALVTCPSMGRSSRGHRHHRCDADQPDYLALNHSIYAEKIRPAQRHRPGCCRRVSARQTSASRSWSSSTPARESFGATRPRAEAAPPGTPRLRTPFWGRVSRI